MYYGQFGIDEYLHTTFFKDFRDGFFVECGACDGVLESTCKFFEDSMGWTGINIEAAPPLFELLKKTRPNCTNLNIALSDKETVSTFKHAIHPSMGTRFGNGSLTHHKSHVQDLLNQGCTFEKYDVQCKKFSDVFNDKREIDLFVLDVEGHELQALKGIMELDFEFLPRVFCIEHSFSGLDNIAHLLGAQYKRHSIHQQNAIYIKK